VGTLADQISMDQGSRNQNRTEHGRQETGDVKQDTEHRIQKTE